MVDLLVQADALRRDRPLSEVEEAGVVQFFEVSIELGWKTLALLMRHQGMLLPVMSPLPIFREAARIGLIGDPDRWAAAVERRNVMSHTYDPDTFRLLIADIGTSFLPMMIELRRTLRGIEVS